MAARAAVRFGAAARRGMRTAKPPSTISTASERGSSSSTGSCSPAPSGGGCGGGTGGEGAGACLGTLPDAPFGELGAGDGLCVLIRSHLDRLEVVYDGELVLERPLDVAALRGRFVGVEVSYAPDGLGVQIDGAWEVRHVLLNTWAPAAGWRFGIGARTGVGRADEHRVDNVRLRAGAAYEARSVPLEIASNGQQFSTSVVQFTHTAPAIVSSFFPERGPESGNTHVVITGANLATASHYLCRFGDTMVRASFDTRDGAIHCASMAQSPGPVPLEVSLVVWVTLVATLVRLEQVSLVLIPLVE